MEKEKGAGKNRNLIKISSMHLLPSFLFWSLPRSDQSKKGGSKCVELILIRLEKIVNVWENIAQTEFENLRWNEGRRIVEIGFLAEQLKSCQKCKTTPLHLKDCVGEIRYGFGSILKIKCICSHINTIYTGKQHRTEDKSDKGLKIWDVNSKAAPL